MSRGRPPARALALATGIAEKRGGVQHFLQAPGLICNFVIYLAGLVAHVRVMRLRHLRCTLTSLEREVGDAFAGLRMIASSPAISRELWICSPRGLFRFFRIESSGLTELDRDGRPLAADAVFSRKRESPATGKQPAQKSGKVSDTSILQPCDQGDHPPGAGPAGRCLRRRRGLHQACGRGKILIALKGSFLQTGHFKGNFILGREFGTPKMCRIRGKRVRNRFFRARLKL